MKLKYLSRLQAKAFVMQTLLGVHLLAIVPQAKAQSDGDKPGIKDGFMFFPGGIKPKPADEYISTNPKIQQFVKVQVQGQTRNSGIFYIPASTSISEAIGLAGGLTDSGSETVRVIRNGESQYFSVYGSALTAKVAADDILVVEKSYRAYLPLVFASISAALSLATLIILVKKK